MGFSLPFYQEAAYVNQSLSCFRAVDWFSNTDWFDNVDWFGELKLIITSVLIASIIIPVALWLDQNPWLDLAIGYTGSTNPLCGAYNNPRAKPNLSTSEEPQRPNTPYDDISRRYTHLCMAIKGGVIILDHTERVDLEFLGLDPLDPPTKRLLSQKDEDDFCQRLLLLGAKWWDSEARCRLLAAVDEMDDRAIYAIDNGDAPTPTLRERRWVSVAWPTTGGLRVAEFDTNLWGVIEGDNVLPPVTARLKLAHTMDERSQVLQDHFEARFYKDVKDYKGYAFLNSWGEKETGEAGPLKPLVLMV